MWVGVLAAVTLVIFVVYLQPWHIPIKYLLPGTVFLIAFQVVPVVATLATSFTNFGDAHRGGKQDAITAIQTNSLGQVAGSAEYVLTIATPGDPATGDIVFLLYDPKTKTVQKGDATGLAPLADAKVTATGNVMSAPGLTVLNLGQAANRSKDVQGLTVPTADGAIKPSGVSKAFELKSTLDYDPTCDCIKDFDHRQDLHRGRESWLLRRLIERRGPAPRLDGHGRACQLHPDLHRSGPHRPASRDRCLELRLRDHHGPASRSLPGCWLPSRSTHPASAVFASTGY